MNAHRRDFLAAGLSLAASPVFAQNSAGPKGAGPQSGRNPPRSSRKAKTTKLFKSPPGFPNGIAVTPEGLWIAEQTRSGGAARDANPAQTRHTRAHTAL